MIRIIVLSITIVLVYTSNVLASVNITEISWMGNSESQFAEWIEFYNDSEEEVSLAGWKLYEAGGETLIFTLTKTIPAKGFLLLERTTSSSPDPVPGVNDESGTFGGSGLSNSGEYLVLKDEAGGIKQSLDFSGGWPAGESDSKKTMQWDGSKWVTATSTPKSSLSNNEIQTAPPTGSSGTDWMPKKIDPKIDLKVPKTIYVDILYEFEARTFLEYGEVFSGFFVWNMGDGTVYKSQKPEIINHKYKYPGSYVVTFGYFKTIYDKKPFLIESIKKDVSNAQIFFKVLSDKGFYFKNNTNENFDLSDWIIRLPDGQYVNLPILSVIAPKSEVVIPFSYLGLNKSFSNAELLTPEWISVSTNKEVVVDVLPINTKNIESNTSLEEQNTIEESLQASSFQSIFPEKNDGEEKQQNKNYTKLIVFSVVFIVVILLFVFLEKASLPKEDQ